MSCKRLIREMLKNKDLTLIDNVIICSKNEPNPEFYVSGIGNLINHYLNKINYEDLDKNDILALSKGLEYIFNHISVSKIKTSEPSRIKSIQILKDIIQVIQKNQSASKIYLKCLDTIISNPGFSGNAKRIAGKLLGNKYDKLDLLIKSVTSTSSYQDRYLTWINVLDEVSKFREKYEYHQIKEVLQLLFSDFVSSLDEDPVFAQEILNVIFEADIFPVISYLSSDQLILQKLPENIERSVIDSAPLNGRNSLVELLFKLFLKTPETEYDRRNKILMAIFEFYEEPIVEYILKIADVDNRFLQPIREWIEIQRFSKELIMEMLNNNTIPSEIKTIFFSSLRIHEIETAKKLIEYINDKVSYSVTNTDELLAISDSLYYSIENNLELKTYLEKQLSELEEIANKSSNNSLKNKMFKLISKLDPDLSVRQFLYQKPADPMILHLILTLFKWQNILKRRLVTNFFEFGKSLTPFIHQKMVVQEILNGGFPVRKLLADEVGLGKTIESSLIIRVLYEMHLAENILILSPPNLTDQWVSELEEKMNLRAKLIDTRFLVSTMEGTKSKKKIHYRFSGIFVSSPDWIVRAKASKLILSTQWDLIIIDEIHLYLNEKMDDKKISSSLRSNLIVALATQYPNILFLTATPGIGADLSGFYNIINVLNPSLFNTKEEFIDYLLEYHAPFFRFVENLLHISNDHDSKIKIEVLDILDSLAKNVKKIVLTKHEDEFKKLISKIKKDISEDKLSFKNIVNNLISLFRIFKLNTVVKRSKRKYVPELSKSKRKYDVRVIWLNSDERELFKIADHFLLKLYARAEEKNLPFGKRHVEDLMKRLTSSVRSFLLALKRKSGRESTLSELTESSEELLISSDSLGEITASWELIKESDEEIKKILELGNKIQVDTKYIQLKGILRQYLRKTEDTSSPKVVIFSSYPDTINDLFERLNNDFKIGQIKPKLFLFKGSDTRAQKTKTIEEFRTLQDIPAVLLTTDADIVGRNLQFCTTIIHYDLHWTPSLVEQRTGRVDRIGKSGNTNVVFLLEYTTRAGVVISSLYEELRKINEQDKGIIEVADDIVKEFLQFALFDSAIKKIGTENLLRNTDNPIEDIWEKLDYIETKENKLELPIEIQKRLDELINQVRNARKLSQTLGMLQPIAHEESINNENYSGTDSEILKVVNKSINYLYKIQSLSNTEIYISRKEQKELSDLKNALSTNIGNNDTYQVIPFYEILNKIRLLNTFLLRLENNLFSISFPEPSKNNFKALPKVIELEIIKKQREILDIIVSKIYYENIELIDPLSILCCINNILRIPPNTLNLQSDLRENIATWFIQKDKQITINLALKKWLVSIKSDEDLFNKNNHLEKEFRSIRKELINKYNKRLQSVDGWTKNLKKSNQDNDSTSNRTESSKLWVIIGE